MLHCCVAVLQSDVNKSLTAHSSDIITSVAVLQCDVNKSLTAHSSDIITSVVLTLLLLIYITYSACEHDATQSLG